ncbi:uncharacterized protein CLUP02_12853 [Colletotrichum lupini]|uniref:Uncharacterized protein n=1 Tax=Colletotrichum lupini TaxID=145971 RepID=A0A9Q8T192_9PEZI|nr:uncharacterized protein CLUP02_12853 [Colletotrichum lupini]UQC87349.1 hypothetical protein CLUP02_12853 [Colletotrichum lupini]
MRKPHSMNPKPFFPVNIQQPSQSGGATGGGHVSVTSGRGMDLSGEDGSFLSVETEL